MATIGNLVVELTSNSSKLRRGLTKAQRSIGKFAKKAANTIKSIGKAFAFISAAAIGGFLVAINKTAAGIDNLAKTSAKLGVTVSELQKLQFAFEQTGVSAEQGSEGIVKMVKNISEAATGTGEAKDALEELGVSAEALKVLKPHEQFRLISEAMKGVKDQSDKVRIAMEIFGRGGSAIVNTLASDVAGLGKEFEALGISITQQQAKNVEAFQDMKNTLASLFKGFAQQVTAEVAPAFTAVIQFIKDSVIEMGGMREVAKSFAAAIVNGLSIAITSVSGLIRWFRELSISIDKAFITLQKILRFSGATLAVDLLSGFDRGDFIKRLEADVATRQRSIGKQTGFEQKLNQLSERLQGTIRNGGTNGPTQEINLNLQTDTGKTVLKLWSNKEFAKRLQAAIGTQTNNAARSGAGG